MTTFWTGHTERAAAGSAHGLVRRVGAMVLGLLGSVAGIAAGQVITESRSRRRAASPRASLTGPDGNIWFVEQVGNRIGRLTLAGVFTEFPVPTPASRPETITIGPDGNLWFTEQDGNKIVRITTDGVMTEFPIPTVSGQAGRHRDGPGRQPLVHRIQRQQDGPYHHGGSHHRIPGPDRKQRAGGCRPPVRDGAVWFVEHDANKVGRITRTGVVTEFPIPTAGSSPWNITAGPDGNLWFSEGRCRSRSGASPRRV